MIAMLDASKKIPAQVVRRHSAAPRDCAVLTIFHYKRAATFFRLTNADLK